MSEPTPCVICGKPVSGYVPVYCCSGRECGCGGGPSEPCCCSPKCEDAVYSYIGHSFDERRQLAGIRKWPTIPADIQEQINAGFARARALEEREPRIDIDELIGMYSRWLHRPGNHMALERNNRSLRKTIHQYRMSKRRRTRKDSHRKKFLRNLNRR